MGRSPLRGLPHGRPAAARAGDRRRRRCSSRCTCCSDFGAVSILRFDSFTRVIYTTYRSSFDREGAAALACAARRGDAASCCGSRAARARRAARYHRIAPGRRSGARRSCRSGRWRWPALAFCGARRARSRSCCRSRCSSTGRRRASPASVDWGVDRGARPGNSLLAAGARRGRRRAVRAAGRAARRAPPRPARRAASSARRFAGPRAAGHRRRARARLPRHARVAPALYQTLAMLVLAYVVLFLPQAIGATRAALLQIDPHVEEAARSLGRTPLGGAAHDHRAARALAACSPARCSSSSPRSRSCRRRSCWRR